MFNTRDNRKSRDGEKENHQTRLRQYTIGGARGSTIRAYSENKNTLYNQQQMAKKINKSQSISSIESDEKDASEDDCCQRENKNVLR